MSGVELPPALRDRVLAEVAAERAPSRRDVQVRRAVAIGACTVALVPLALGLRADFHELPTIYALGTAVLLGAASGSLLAFGLSRGAAMMGPKVAVLTTAALLAPALVAAWVLLGLAAVPKGPVLDDAAALRATLVCDGMALLLATPPLFAMLAYRRVFSATSPALVGATLGAAAGCLAHLGVHLHCSINDPSHVMIGHLLPALPLAALGAWVLARRQPARGGR